MTCIHVHIDVTQYTFALLVSGEVTSLWRTYEGAFEAFVNLNNGEFDLAIIDAITCEVLCTN